MTDLPDDVAAGSMILDDFLESSSTLIEIPPDLSPEALTYIAKVQADARRAVADAEFRLIETIAADFDRLQAGYVCRGGVAKGLLMAPGAAAARVRSMAALRRAA